MAANAQSSNALIEVHGLSVALPTGRALLRDLDFSVNPGEVVVILGGSGAGKTVLLRALFDREALLDAGFKVTVKEINERSGKGLVPQRGAVFDHLDVAGNLEVALRNADPPRDDSNAVVRDWLRRVDLPEEMARPGTPVTSLSGGQGQRLAVARTLANGRPLLFFDEPSAGLDPFRVRMLAKEIRKQGVQDGGGSVVTTHDVILAAGVADRLLLLDPSTHQLVPILPDEWGGPQAGAPEEQVLAWQSKLEAELVRLLSQGGEGAGAATTARIPAFSRARRFLEPFRVAGVSLVETFKNAPRRWRDFGAVLKHSMRQSFWRPLPFYLIVSTLLGFTVLYVVTNVVPAGVKASRAIEMVGASYITALTPPLSAFLFVATSGNAVHAWLGGMSLTKQITALEALGIPRGRYLWGPAWTGLGMAFIGTAALFAGGLLAGGLLLCYFQGVDNGWQLLGADLFDPAPDRVKYTVRAGLLVWIYAWGIASDAVARGSAHKDAADDVTVSMTRSVVSCTLWVVVLELVSVFILFALRKGPA